MTGKFNFLRTTLSRLRQSVQIAKAKEVYIGVDQHGNQYYEKHADESKGMKKVRRVQPIDPDLTKVPTVPVEWMTWLQGRRSDPPTQKEIEDNYVQMLKVQHRAVKLDEDSQAQSETNASDEKSLTFGQNEQSFTKTAAAFPKYEDYESVPGEKKDIR